MFTKEHILAEIQRTAGANGGRPLGRARFEAETGVREGDWLGRYWTKWGDALSEAGFAPNTLNAAIPTVDLIERLARLAREVGHFPTDAELKMKHGLDPSFPSSNTFWRLGSKRQRAQAVLEFCERSGNLDDVAALCQQLTDGEPMAHSDPALRDEAGPKGFVYLMKSGRYYKIGRSVCAEKRAREVQLVLPEELRLVHKIATDDPVGIEAYWHSRFAAKRKMGEWFDLRADDVAAFKRRKFM